MKTKRILAGLGALALISFTFLPVFADSGWTSTTSSTVNCRILDRFLCNTTTQINSTTTATVTDEGPTATVTVTITQIQPVASPFYDAYANGHLVGQCLTAFDLNQLSGDVGSIPDFDCHGVHN